VPADKTEVGPFGVSIAAGKTEVIATYVVNSGGGGNLCGKPKLSITKDLKTWSTCSVYGGPDPSVGSNSQPSAAAAPDGVLYVVFSNSEDTSTVPPGILVWTGDV